VSVDREEVDRIAALARLRLDSTEGEALTMDMNRILEHVDRLQDAMAGGGHAAALEGRDGEGSSRAEAEEAQTRGGAADAARDAVEGVRDPAAESPDPLVADVSGFAPAVQEGFFVVPPPQGVTVPDGEPSP
jgi:Asp-tRNA(Asn)/Glu-tRNA(Gln) amidotransferase C subunit